MPRTGRRPGTGGTREKILAAARSRFGQEGYDGTTIRGIAAGAGVDPALVPHYFGSKEGVFLAAVEFPVDPAEFIPRLLAPANFTWPMRRHELRHLAIADLVETRLSLRQRE